MEQQELNGVGCSNGAVDRSSIFGGHSKSNGHHQEDVTTRTSQTNGFSANNSSSASKMSSSASSGTNTTATTSRQFGQTFAVTEDKTHDDLGLPLPEPLAVHPPHSSDGIEHGNDSVGIGKKQKLEQHQSHHHQLDSSEVISRLSTFDLKSNKFTSVGEDLNHVGLNGNDQEIIPGRRRKQNQPGSFKPFSLRLECSIRPLIYNI